MASLWRRRCIRKGTFGEKGEKYKMFKEGAIKEARKLKFGFN
jgi:hypothetical protein